MNLNQDSWILLASLTLSIVITLGFLFLWGIGKFFGEEVCGCIIYYAAYLAFVNIPELALTVFAGDFFRRHTQADLFLDLLGVVFVFAAARGWSDWKDPRWHWLLAAGSALLALAHHATGSPAWANAYALSFVVLLIYTVWQISRDAPTFVTVLVSAGFSTWILLSVLFPHSGNPVGHAFGMVVKVVVFGSIMLAIYERQHRHLYEAALARKRAIDAYTGHQTSERAHGWGLTESGRC